MDSQLLIVFNLFLLLMIRTASCEECKQIRFAGRDWNVKCSKQDPGPNNFSNDNVQVNDQGHLELLIANQSEIGWTTAEIYSVQQGFGYGTYEFEVKSDLSALDPQVVVGLYTWDDACDQFHREIDIEFAKWGNSQCNTNAQYVIQPYNETGNLVRFKQTKSESTRHSFEWTSKHIHYHSESDQETIFDWTYDGSYLIEPGKETVRMNLWLWQGNGPAAPVQVTITNFQFTPLGSAKLKK